MRSVADQFYPNYKAPVDYWTKDEIEELLRKEEFDKSSFELIIRSLDERITPDGANLGKVRAFVELLASKLYDKSFGLTKELYDKVMEIDLAESSKGHE